MLPDPPPYVTDLSGPRQETRHKLHQLSDILMMVFCAVLSGIEDGVGREAFAEQEGNVVANIFGTAQRHSLA